MMITRLARPNIAAWYKGSPACSDHIAKVGACTLVISSGKGLIDVFANQERTIPCCPLTYITPATKRRDSVAHTEGAGDHWKGRIARGDDGASARTPFPLRNHLGIVDLIHSRRSAPWLSHSPYGM